jgi:hypothetical protein
MANGGVKVRYKRTKIGRSYRAKTLRQMPPVTRELARLRGELASVDRRLKNLIPKIKEVERVANIARTDSIEVLDRLAESKE